MPVRSTRKAGNGPSRDQLSREMRRSRLSLFIQQFEKEALERMNDLEAKTERMLSTVDKAFKVELLKMPPALQKTRLGDLISADEVSASEVSVALKSESREMPQAVRRMASKRTKSTDSPPVQSTPAQRSSSRTAKDGKGPKRAKTASSATISRTQSCLTKTSSGMITNQTKPKLRSVVSAGDMHCAMENSSAHVTVTTGRGQTVCFSEETKNEINWDMLDDVAWYQIQRLTSLMENLSQRKKDS